MSTVVLVQSTRGSGIQILEIKKFNNHSSSSRLCGQVLTVQLVVVQPNLLELAQGPQLRWNPPCAAGKGRVPHRIILLRRVEKMQPLKIMSRPREETDLWCALVESNI